jgi:hypothetical protein
MAEIVRLFPEPSRLKRPAPPAGMLDAQNFEGPTFVSAPELESWLRSTFIEEGAPLQNEDHFHLRYAQIGVLWTSIENSRHGRRVVGQAERGEPAAMGKWAKARAELQIIGWFGDIPDFILTFDARYARTPNGALWWSMSCHTAASSATCTARRSSASRRACRRSRCKATMWRSSSALSADTARQLPAFRP